MKHDIPADYPILALSIREFNSSETATIATLLWLYNEKWITPNENKKYKQLGGISKTMAEKFYCEIYQKIHQAINESYKPQPAALLSIACPNITVNHCSAKIKSIHWLNSNQITGWVQAKPLYDYLFNSAMLQSTPNQLSLVEKYPTIKLLLSQFPIRLHPDVSRELQQIYHMNLSGAVGLTDEIYALLGCYMAIFVSRHASIIPTTMNCTYAHDNMKATIQSVMDEQAEKLITHLQQGEIQFSQTLDKVIFHALAEKNIAFDPDFMGLLCFETFPLLKQLFIANLAVKAEKIHAPHLSLYPTEHSFFFGYILYDKEKVPVRISTADLHVVVDLVKSRSKGIEFFDNSSKPCLDRFDKIKDPLLRMAITPETLANYKLYPFTNYGAVERFLEHYGITATTNIEIPLIHLQSFVHMLSFYPGLKDKIINKLQNCVTFIQLQDTNSLERQIELARQRLVTLNDKIESISPKSREQATALGWFGFQKEMWSQFYGTLVAKQHESELQSVFSAKM